MEDTGSRTEADAGRHERIRAALHGPHHDPYDGYSPNPHDNEPCDWMVAVMDDEPEERP